MSRLCAFLLCSENTTYRFHIEGRVEAHGAMSAGRHPRAPAAAKGRFSAETQLGKIGYITAPSTDITVPHRVSNEDCEAQAIDSFKSCN